VAIFSRVEREDRKEQFGTLQRDAAHLLEKDAHGGSERRESKAERGAKFREMSGDCKSVGKR
jgi:hypothetical protein